MLFDGHRNWLVAAVRSHRSSRILQRIASYEPDDIVQEVFRRLLASGLFEAFENRKPGSLRALLTVLLERTMNDRMRRAGALKRAAVVGSLDCDEKGRADDSSTGMMSKEATPTSNARSSELLARLTEVLTDFERSVLKLTAVNGMDSVEIGGHLGKSSSTVRDTLRRARSKASELALRTLRERDEMQ